MSTRSTRRTLVALTLAGAALLGACGGDDEPEAAVVEGPTMDNSEETLISYVEEFQEGYLTANGENTYPTLSAECQNEWTQEEWAANADAMAELVEFAANVPSEEIQVVNIEVHTIDESSATLSFELADATGEVILDDEGLPLGRGERKWIHENGGWRTTHCESVADAFAGG